MPQQTERVTGVCILTFVVKIVGGRGKDLHGTSEVEKIKLGVQGDKHVNGLIGHSRSLVHTHFAGIGGGGGVCVGREWCGVCRWSRESIGGRVGVEERVMLERER